MLLTIISLFECAIPKYFTNAIHLVHCGMLGNHTNLIDFAILRQTQGCIEQWFGTEYYIPRNWYFAIVSM